MLYPSYVSVDNVYRVYYILNERPKMCSEMEQSTHNNKVQSIGTHFSSSFDRTKTKHGKGTGVVYLVPLPDSKWMAYPLLTCLDSLTELPEKVCAVIIWRYFV